MEETQKTKEGVQTEEGQPEEEKPASETNGPTTPLDLGTMVTIDSKGTQMPLGDVIQGYHRGKGRDELQSDFHKLTAAYEESAAQVVAKEAELDEIRSRELIQEELKKANVPASTPASTATGSTDYGSWPTEEEQPPAAPAIDMKAIARLIEERIDSAAALKLGDIKELTEKQYIEIRDKERAETARQDAVKQAYQDERKVRTQKLSQRGVPAEAIQGILALEDVAAVREAEAADFIRNGEEESFRAAFATSESFKDQAIEARMKAYSTAEKVKQEQELSAMLETGSSGVLESEDEEVDRKPRFTPDGIAERKESAKKKALGTLSKIRQVKSSLGKL